MTPKSEILTFGTWLDYQKHRSLIPELSVSEKRQLIEQTLLKCLKAGLTRNSNKVPYSKLLKSIGSNDLAQLESLLRELVYSQKLIGKLDLVGQQVVIHNVNYNERVRLPGDKLTLLTNVKDTEYLKKKLMEFKDSLISKALAAVDLGEKPDTDTTSMEVDEKGSRKRKQGD